MPISHTHQCIFIHIPKTGGTSLETALDLFHDWRVENRAVLFGKIQSPELLEKGWLSRYLQHLSIREVETLVAAEVLADYLSFSWVRNPWGRMVSIYCNQDPDMLQKALDEGIPLKGLSFPDFLDASQDFQHVHLLDQASFILNPQGAVAVDFIGRFESFAADFVRLCECLQMPLSLNLPHRNASAHKPYREYYSDKTRAQVARRYCRDMDLFSYTF